MIDLSILSIGYAFHVRKFVLAGGDAIRMETHCSFFLPIQHMYLYIFVLQGYLRKSEELHLLENTFCIDFNM